MTEVVEPEPILRFAPSSTYIFVDRSVIGVIEGALVHLPAGTPIDLRVVGDHRDAIVLGSTLYLDHKGEGHTGPGEAWIGMTVALSEPGANDLLRPMPEDFRDEP